MIECSSLISVAGCGVGAQALILCPSCTVLSTQQSRLKAEVAGLDFYEKMRSADCWSDFGIILVMVIL
jgi:hypothetical protein